MDRQTWTNRTVDWFDERLDVMGPLKAFLQRPVPPHVSHWMYCLGGITFFFGMVLGITGVLLALYYRPTPEGAYDSILLIMNEVRFGWLIRSMHSWSASLMVIFAVLHLLRVFVTGSFKPPRELNWIAGVVLGVLVLAFGYTGYLLPWDQRAYWATTVGTDIMGSVPFVGDLVLRLVRGGADVTALTLTRFYGAHVLILPAVFLAALAGHFVMIHRQGISGPL
jgi:quinol-cytochrome oxidoreductase complex cytochrome b subunit